METLFFRVAAVSAAVSVVLLPLLLLPQWRKHYAPHTRRAVWLVIAAVLLAAPLLPKSRAPVQITVPERAVTISTAAPAAPQNGTVPVQPVTPETAVPETPVQTAETAAQTPAETPAARTVEWGALFAALWVAGGAAVLLWQGTAFLLARRRVMRSAVPFTGYEELAAELCPRRSVRFFQADGFHTPMTLGVFRPVVLLPREEVRQAAVRHELIHIRRRDVAWKILLLLACAVHWFNPLVWLMSRRADRDMEASCDAAVLSGGDPAERRAYGELLLETAAGRKVPLTTRFGGGKKLMKERLYDLFHPGKKSRVLVVAVLLLCLAAGSLVACKGADNGSDGETDVSALDGQVADGVYCASVSYASEVSLVTDYERLELTLFEYDPESGVRGAELGRAVLPLAENVMLQGINAESPSNPGAQGSDARRRQVFNFIQWPMLRAQTYPDRTDLLEVQVEDGAVTYLRWFQVPAADDSAEEALALERTTETLPGKYDFDHDGEADTINLVTVWGSEKKNGVVWYELQVKAADGTVLWTGEAAPPHAGWNSLFACTLNGKDYLLRYNPTMYQGLCTYHYRVFSLGLEGKEIVFQENSVSFATNFGSPLFESFDADAVADFMDGVNSLLAQSKLLFSTDEELKGIDPEQPQHTPTWLTCDNSYFGYTYDETKTMRENLLAIEQAAEAFSAVQTSPKVGVYIDSDPTHYDPMGSLTQEQKDLLSDLPVDELPRQAVDLRKARRSQFWQDTLIPLANNETYDVTLYGVVSADSLRDLEDIPLESDGIVLRAGDRVVYVPLPWFDNAYWRINPWMEIADFDGDGQAEAAVCTHWGRGTGVSAEALCLFELDTLAHSVPDYSTLDIDVAYDPSSHTAALAANGHSVTVEVEPQLEPLEGVSCSSVVSFSCEDGQLFCHVSLDFSGSNLAYLAKATAPVIWDGDGYCLGSVTELATID